MGIVLFFLVVKNKGAFGGGYTILVIPFEYMAIGWLVSSCPRLSLPISRSALRRIVLGVLFLLNGGAFLAVVTSDLLLWPALDPSDAQALVQRTIPPGSRVVGDDKFYFLVRRAGSDFQYMERGGTLEERVRYHAGPYDFDYLVSDEDENSEILRAYRASAAAREARHRRRAGGQRPPPVSAARPQQVHDVGLHQELRRDRLQADPLTRSLRGCTASCVGCGPGRCSAPAAGR